MIRTLTRLCSVLLFLLTFTPKSLAAAPESGATGSAWDDQAPERPRLQWETLRGYRLFFHPDDEDSYRHSLVVDVPLEVKARTAWALISPVLKNVRWDDEAWLRVEGVAEPGRMRITWDGRYRDQEFQDKLYWFQTHLRKEKGEAQDWQVLVVKSKDHPRFHKVAGRTIETPAFNFVGGEFIPLYASLTVSASADAEVPVEAKVYLPDLPQPFTIEGVQVAVRFIEDLQGRAPFKNAGWECLCQQTIPGDSPARKKAKVVRCLWPMSAVKPGLYELKLSLWHKLNHPAQRDSCDVPELDQERIRIIVQP
jgi:hypothetical protein